MGRRWSIGTSSVPEGSRWFKSWMFQMCFNLFIFDLFGDGLPGHSPHAGFCIFHWRRADGGNVCVCLWQVKSPPKYLINRMVTNFYDVRIWSICSPNPFQRIHHRPSQISCKWKLLSAKLEASSSSSSTLWLSHLKGPLWNRSIESVGAEKRLLWPSFSGLVTQITKSIQVLATFPA